jgi:hypothetical protein
MKESRVGGYRAGGMSSNFVVASSFIPRTRFAMLVVARRRPLLEPPRALIAVQAAVRLKAQLPKHAQVHEGWLATRIGGGRCACALGSRRLDCNSAK